MRGALGEQTVLGADLILRRRHQGFVEIPRRTGDVALHAGDREIEIVEGAERDLPRDTALRRFRIHIIELREAGRIFEVPEQRQAVAPGCTIDRSFGARRARPKRTGAEAQNRSRCGQQAALQKMSSGQRHDTEIPVRCGLRPDRTVRGFVRLWRFWRRITPHARPTCGERSRLPMFNPHRFRKTKRPGKSRPSNIPILENRYFSAVAGSASGLSEFLLR